MVGQGPNRCRVDEEVLDGEGGSPREARTSTLARLTEEDFRRAEDFISLVKVLYTSTLCVSSEKSPTCGQILPILHKLQAHLTVKEGDTVFVSNLKKQVWANLSKRYQNDEIRHFLQVATALDPRFKHKLNDDDTAWDQIQRRLIEQRKTLELMGTQCNQRKGLRKRQRRRMRKRRRVNHLPASCPGRLHWRNCLLRKRHRT
ncbi:E3 SUMO-protein ligase ZBED1-like isoform X2 [Acanthochromis polyacanthus]|uniref:E3 SUMO-protein ligase ZBED1-like isoform X2 n=1 Tax=Acanthochromis polyacanthus TaxID=80966 RepID=UPI00223469EA|nr:E3 SUMO-protein ligase ZBED1-like isoform X2 [Acanthochromis polyacanthus]